MNSAWTICFGHFSFSVNYLSPNTARGFSLLEPAHTYMVCLKVPLFPTPPHPNPKGFGNSSVHFGKVITHNRPFSEDLLRKKKIQENSYYHQLCITWYEFFISVYPFQMKLKKFNFLINKLLWMEIKIAPS